MVNLLVVALSLQWKMCDINSKLYFSIFISIKIIVILWLNFSLSLWENYVLTPNKGHERDKDASISLMI